MVGLIYGISLFLEVIQLFVFVDIILSWVSFIGIKFRPRFIYSVLDPLYILVKKVFPTIFGPFDLSAFIVIVACMFLKGIIVIMYPSLFVL